VGTGVPLAVACGLLRERMSGRTRRGGAAAVSHIGTVPSGGAQR